MYYVYMLRSQADDELMKVRPMLERVDEWRGFLAAGGGEDYEQLYERHESTGRPLGPKRYVVLLEKALARVLQPRKRGRKPLRLLPLLRRLHPRPR